MNFKKRINGSWVDTPNYIHNTSTDTITTLPTVLYPNDTTATVGLKGNMSQASGVSPDNPIQPQECGDRTAQLFDKDNFTFGTGTTIVYIPLYVGDGTFTLSTDFPDNETKDVFFLSGNVDSGASSATNGVDVHKSRTTSSIDGYVTIATRYNSVRENPADYNYMLNTGSTALPYEPYGIKIPISSGNTTTPVYLGEAQSTRRIKKLVLTGAESFFRDREREGSWRFYSDALISAKDGSAICSHFENIGTDGVNNSDNVGFCLFYKAQFGCRFPKSIAATVTDFKSYLAAQYAAGTPVTVWYVLATEETAVVNEPLMKIGEYADTVSGIAIPTIAGKDTFDVLTTLKPSEVSANYHGWHTGTVHERDNGAWD